MSTTGRNNSEEAAGLSAPAVTFLVVFVLAVSMELMQAFSAQGRAETHDPWKPTISEKQHEDSETTAARR